MMGRLANWGTIAALALLLPTGASAQVQSPAQQKCVNGMNAALGKVVKVQQGEVGSPADVQQKVDSVRKENRKSVLMLIQRQDGLQWVPLSIGSDKDKQPG